MCDPPTRATDASVVARALRVGDVLPQGWTIDRVERLEQGTRFVVLTSAAPVRVVVELPRAGNRYLAKTERLGIWVDADDDPESRGLRGALAQAVADQIRAHEGRDESAHPIRPRSSTRESTPILYLVPGHMSDPDDLSLRALHVLAAVPVVFVENDKADEVRALLTRFNLRPIEGPGAPEIVELGHDDVLQAKAVKRWRAAVAAGLDSCLFGANEGIPGFCDKGKALVIAAAEARDTVRIRSIGGSSALGHALMRVPSRLEAFEFGGILNSDADARRLTATLALRRLPLVFFTHGATLRKYLPAALQESGLRTGTVHLLCAFTSDDEHAIAIGAAGFVAPEPGRLPDHQPIVVVIERDRSGDGIARFRDRLRSWLRRA